MKANCFKGFAYRIDTPLRSVMPVGTGPACAAIGRSTRVLEGLKSAAGMSRLRAFCLALALTGFAASSVAAPPEEAISAALAQYATVVHATYADAHKTAKTLEREIRRFTADPSKASLQSARKAWLLAREFYGQSETFRFYAGPIDDERGLEGRINAWPMDEMFVDGGSLRPDAGLINDRSVSIDKDTLASFNERGGEENISTGWHAIEFLLWGADTSVDGPGDRSFEDFVDGRAPNADRRRRYLEVVTELLVDDLEVLVKAWAPGGNNYRAGFERDGMESLRKIFLGMTTMSRFELAGERMEVAMASQDQEDEQSCFSDNTHRDHVNAARGIENVWLGRYRRHDGKILSGASLRGLVAARDPGLAERATRRIAEAVAAAEAIQAPFDREILGADDAPGRVRVQNAIDSLKRQDAELVAAAAALGIAHLNLTQSQ